MLVDGVPGVRCTPVNVNTAQKTATSEDGHIERM